jgi:hypothetical protein
MPTLLAPVLAAQMELHVGEVLFWGAKEYGSVCPDDVNATGLFLVSFLK